MNKAEFAAIVDELLAKAQAISINDCQAGLNVVDKYKWLANMHREHLPADITEAIAEIESLFERASRCKNGGNVGKLQEHHHLAARLIVNAVTELKQANLFPE